MRRSGDDPGGLLPAAIVERVLACPAVRPLAVERARAQLDAGVGPDAEDLASAVVDGMMSLHPTGRRGLGGGADLRRR